MIYFSCKKYNQENNIQYILSTNKNKNIINNYNKNINPDILLIIIIEKNKNNSNIINSIFFFIQPLSTTFFI